MWPAVPSVSGLHPAERVRGPRRPPAERPRRSACAGRAAPARRGSARSPGALSRSACGQRLGLDSSSATTGPSSSSSGSAPPPTWQRLESPARGRRSGREPLRPRRQRRFVRGQHRQDRDLVAAPAADRGTGGSVASSAASESLSIRSARASGCRRAAATASRRPTHQPGLRSPEQLVARAAHERRAGRHRIGNPRLAARHPAARHSAARHPQKQVRTKVTSVRTRLRAGAGAGERHAQPARADVVDHRHSQARTALAPARPRRTRRSGSSTGERA